MNYNEIKFIDSDLREALRRMYANTPPPPADLTERTMKGIKKTEICTAQNGKPQQPQEDYIPNDTTAICFPEPIIR